MELNRDNIKYDKTGFDDTVFLMYQYASAFAKKHADVKTYLSAAIHNSKADINGETGLCLTRQYIII